MAIQEITDLDIVQRCAVCDRENRVALANLAVGVERDDQVEDGVVPLPECPTCRSREFLVRSPASEQAHPSQGSSGHLHRLMVDELHSQLVKKGRVVERLVSKSVITNPTGAPNPIRKGPLQELLETKGSIRTGPPREVDVCNKENWPG